MLHFDEAGERTVTALLDFLRGRPSSWRALLVSDVRARFRVILWCPPAARDHVAEELGRWLAKAGGRHWSGDILWGQSSAELPDGAWQERAWREGETIETGVALRALERHLAKVGWFQGSAEPPWRLNGKGRGGAAVCGFYSFKGGVGRSTALAASALHFASQGDRVVVLDADLDSPGVGSLLPGQGAFTSQLGLVDYLVEAPLSDGDDGLALDQFWHRCSSSLHGSKGEVLVFPAGVLDERYIGKLARVDYGSVAGDRGRSPFGELLRRIEAEVEPNWILIDARAGLGEVSGFLTGGICHLYVLLGSLADASWRGLRLVLDRLGAERLGRGRTQSECLLAAAMVPSVEAGQYERALSAFTDRARDAFSEVYYAESGEPDAAWTVDDLANVSDAPHVPVGLPYDSRLALFGDLEDVAESVLLRPESPYSALAARVRRSVALLRRDS